MLRYCKRCVLQILHTCEGSLKTVTSEFTMFFFSCFTACVRPKLDIVSFDIRSSVLPPQILSSTWNAPHIRFSVSIRHHFRFSFFFLRCQSAVEHRDLPQLLLMTQTSRHVGRVPVKSVCDLSKLSKLLVLCSQQDVCRVQPNDPTVGITQVRCTARRSNIPRSNQRWHRPRKAGTAARVFAALVAGPCRLAHPSEVTFARRKGGKRCVPGC